MANSSLLAADLLMRIGVDASGVETEIASKLTRAERAAVASGDRIAAGVSRGADKASAAQLRVVAATERYNKVLQSGKATQGQIASAQASLITAQRTYQRELSQTATAAQRVTAAERTRGAALKDNLRSAGLGIAAFKAAQTVRESIDLSKEYQDAVDRNASALGKSASDITRFANTTAGAYNLSNLAAEKFVGDFALLFEKSGSSTEKATQQAIALTRRLADVRSFYGGTLDDAKTAFQSALVGENEPIRRYGVLLDEARLKQIAFSQGLVKDTTSTLPPAVKAQAAYAAILQQTTKAQGDVSRTSDSAANSAEDAREKFERAKVTLGEGLLPVYTSLAQTSAELAPALSVVGKGIGAVFGNDVSRRAVLTGAALTGGLLAANKAVKLYGEISANVFRRQATKVAANAAVSRSYDAITSSAIRATAAESAKAAAGRTNAITAAAQFRAGMQQPGQGRFARFAGGVDPVSLGIIGTSLLAPEGYRAGSSGSNLRAGLTGAMGGVGLVSTLAGKLFGGDDAKRKGRETVTVINQTTGAIEQMSRAEADAAAATQAAADAAKRRREEFARLRDSLGVDAFATVARQDNVSTARSALTQAIQARNDANRALGEARSASVGGDSASANDIRAAQLRLQAAQQRAREEGATPSERASVIAAQERLNDLRNKGKATVDQTKDAEVRVADAIRNQEEAQKRVNEARKALQQANGLGQAAVLGRLRGNVVERERFGKDVRQLEAAGLARPVLDQLLTLERDAPGTIRKIVRQGITPTFVKEMNEGLARLEKVQTSLTRSLTRASTSASKAAAEAAAQVYYPRFIGKLRELAENDPAGFEVPVHPTATTQRNTKNRLNARVRDGGFQAP